MIESTQTTNSDTEAVWYPYRRQRAWLMIPTHCFYPFLNTHPSTVVTRVHQSRSQQRQPDWFELSTHHNKRSGEYLLTCAGLCACVLPDSDIRDLVYLASFVSSKHTGESSIVGAELSSYSFSYGRAHQRGALEKCKAQARTCNAQRAWQKCKRHIANPHVPNLVNIYTTSCDRVI